MRDYCDAFGNYLTQVKHVSPNTLDSYLRDVTQYLQYLREQQVKTPTAASPDTITAYVQYLQDAQKSNATIMRHIASVRCFYQHLMLNGEASCNPAKGIKLERAPKKLPQILTGAEIELLLSQPDPQEPKGCRDKAMLELLYATGIRATELVDLNVDDVNLHTGVLYCRGERGERIIPMYQEAVTAVSDYIFRIRRMIIAPDGGQALFTNLNGHRLTRQGFWKIVKGYAERAGITKEITPHTLRHSFALHLLQNGAELKDIQHMLGHADISSTQMYMHMMDDHFKEVYNQCHPRAKSG